MKIVEVRATPVTVPLSKPLHGSYGTAKYTTRTIVELVTEDGLVGIGETRGGAEIAAAVHRNRGLFAEIDVFAVTRMAKRFSTFRLTSEQLVGANRLAGAAVEMASWDLVGKAMNVRCGDLWGGIERETVEVTAYVSYRHEDAHAAREADLVADTTEHAEELFDRYGFRDIKFKTGVVDPTIEIRSVEAMRSRLGSRLRFIRIDPNAAWSVQTSVRVLRALDGHGLEFCEDPTWGLEGLALVRERVAIPLATNMACISFEQIPPAVHLRALDIILGDVHYWGGPTAVTQLAKICETFNLGMSMHSDLELGISTSAILHLTAAIPTVSHSIDSLLPNQADDVITEPHTFTDGHLAVPQGPGLGVELDREKLDRYSKLHLEIAAQGEPAGPPFAKFQAFTPKF